MSTLLFTQAVAGVVFSLLIWQSYRKRPGRNLPPGPKPFPLVGNIRDLPPKGVPEYHHWLKHKDVYGPITSVTVLGRTIVVIHDRQAAIDIMEKKALKNSSRPNMEFAFGMCDFSQFTSGQAYNETLRLHRKLIHQQFGTKTAVARFSSEQEAEVRQFLLSLLRTPEQLADHLQTQAGALILKLTYGYEIDRHGRDPLVELVTRMMAIFSKAVVPGAWLVDIVPALKYLPDWAPGAGFKETARRWRKVTRLSADAPFDFVKRRMAENSHRPSYVANALKQDERSPDPNLEHAIKYSAGALYGGGAETNAATLRFFFLAMAKFPDVQRKAQEEIDRVMGVGRLPSFEHREKLPYIGAIVKETYRWQPVGPMGFPHTADEDGEYEGYLIPKGAVLIPAVWWFAHDPEVYHDPDAFLPERFLTPYNEQDPSDYVFGFGRRICPGQLLADTSIFLTIAQTLAVFDVDRAIDDQGNTIDPVVGIKSGTVSHPVDFPFRITPRSSKHAELVKNTVSAQSSGGSDAAHLQRYRLVPEDQLRGPL